MPNILRLVAWSALISSAAPIWSAETGLIQEIRTAWQVREDAVKTAEFEWTVLMRRQVDSLGDAGLPTAAASPEELANAEQIMSLRLDGEMLEFNSETVSDDAGRLISTHRAVYDRELSLSLSNHRGSNSTGVISAKPHEFGKRNAQIGPLLLVYRPLSETMSGISLRRCRIVSRSRPLGEADCVVIEQRDGNYSRILWLDPDRGYLPLRYQTQIGGRDSISKEFEYTSDSDGGWVPSRWTLTYLTEHGELGQSATMAMVRHTINEPIAVERFQLTFPPNTFLWDKRSDKEIVLTEPFAPSTEEFGQAVGVSPQRAFSVIRPDAQAGRSWLPYWLSALGLSVLAAAGFLVIRSQRSIT